MPNDPANRLIRRGRRALGANVPLAWWVIGIVVVPIALFVGERMWPKPERPKDGSHVMEINEPNDIKPQNRATPGTQPGDGWDPGTDPSRTAPERAEEAIRGPSTDIAAFIGGDASREERWAAYCAQDRNARFEVAIAAGAALADLTEWRRSHLLGRANYGCVLVSPTGQKMPYTNASALEGRLCWEMRCPQ